MKAPRQDDTEARYTVLPSGPGPLHLHMPVDVRSYSMAWLALLATLYAMHWASPVLIPFLLGLMLSYALSPLVNGMAQRHVPRALGAAIVLALGAAGVGLTVYRMADDAATLAASLPDAAQRMRDALRKAPNAPDGAIDQVQKAAARLEQAAAESTAPPRGDARGVTRVQIEPARFNVKDYVWSGTRGAAHFLGQLMIVLVITFFLLASGDQFRRKLVRIAGPTLTRKKITLQVLDDITHQIHRYLMVQVYTSALVGVATGLALWAVGLERPAVWGVAAALLNLVPYVGSLVITGAIALVAFMQFGTPGMAVFAGGTSLVIHAVVGNLITPWLTGRTSRMSPVVIFVGVLAFGWLLGLWGLLLGAPILIVVKLVCDRIEDLKPVGELLGR